MKHEEYPDIIDNPDLPQAWTDESEPDPRLADLAPVLGEVSIRPRMSLDLKLNHAGIRLGQKKMPFRLPKEQVDYTDYRYRFFAAMVASQSEPGEAHPELKPLQIWAMMGEEGKFPTELMIGIKRWLPSLTYRGKKIIEGNGKRGRGATYWINQAFLLNVRDKIAESVPAEEPLPSSAEVYEAVRHLTQFDFALREHGVLEMEPGLEMALQDTKPDYAKLREEGVDLRDFRAEAAAKLSKLLTDRDYISRYKKSLEKDSPEYGLLRYIYDLTPNERFFVKGLLGAQLVPARMGGELRLEAIDERGMIIAVMTPRGATEALDPIEDSDETGESQTPAEHWEEEDVIFERGRRDQPGSGEIRFKNELEEAMLGLVKDVAETVALTFLENFRADKVYTREQLLNIFPKLTVPVIVSARDNNILPNQQQLTAKGRLGLSLEDVIRVSLYSDSYLQNMVTTRKYRKPIEAIIERVINETTEATDRILNGEDED